MSEVVERRSGLGDRGKVFIDTEKGSEGREFIVLVVDEELEDVLYTLQREL